MRPFENLQLSGARQKAALGILGADACLDGVTVKAHLALRQRQLLTRGDAQLPLHQVESGHRLRDRMFHLQPRVHFHEVELAAVEQEFDGPGAHVADLACHHQRRGAQAPAQLLGQRGCRRFFDELLMTSLRRAVALAQVHEVALAVGKHLHLDVARLRQIALQEQRPVAEGALGEAACGGERRRQFGSVAHDLHALAAAPGRGFDDERQPGTLRLAREVLQVLLGAGVPGQHRHAGRAHARLGDDLRTHRGDGCGGQGAL